MNRNPPRAILARHRASRTRRALERASAAIGRLLDPPAVPCAPALGTWAALMLVAVGAVPAAGLQDAEEAEDRFETVLDLAFTTASGNQDITLLTTDLGFTHLNPEAFRLEAGAGARFGRSEGEKVAENYRAQADLAFTPEARWSPFLFTEAEHDPFRRLDLRTSAGAGARYRFCEAERGSASISGALLYSYENFAPDPELADSLSVPSEQNARLSWRLKGERELTENVTLEHVTFYQPVWDTVDDYLLDAQTTARVRVSDAVALTISYIFERDSTPPPDVGRDDRLFTAGVSIDL
jgi:hypothetical protein